MSFLWYVLKSVLRHPRRSVAALLGVALALVFISGTFVAIDSSARGTLRGLLANVAVDYTVFINTVEYDQAAADVLALDGVTEVVSSARTGDFEIGTWDAPSSVQGELFGIRPEKPPPLIAGLTVRGSLTLAPGRAVFPEATASALGADLGDVVYVRETDSGNASRLVNLTVEGILQGTPDEGFEPLWDFILIHLDEFRQLEARLLGFPGPPVVFLHIWVDRERLIDPYDLDLSRENLVRLQRTIEATLDPYESVGVLDHVSWVLGSVESGQTIFRLIFLFVAIPVLFLGLYVGVVGIDLAYGERRRELAVLRTRGAGGRQILGLLVLEALVLGLLAGGLGLLGGLGLSWVLVPAVSSFAGFPTFEPRLVPALETVVMTLAFGVAFLFLVSFRAARRTASRPLVESLATYAPREAAIHYNPKVDLVLVGIGVAVLGIVLYAQVTPGGFVLFLVGLVAFVLAPLAPALILIGGTRLLTLSSTRLYDWASRILKPVAGNLYHLIRRNLTRNPRRTSHLAVIVAVGLAFGVLSSTILASQIAWEERQLRAFLGADLVATPPLTDPGFLDNLSAVAGVAEATPLVRFNTLASVGVGGRYIPAHALDPESFFAVTQPEPWYTAPLSVDEASRLLVQEGSVLVTKLYAEEEAVAIGDTLVLQPVTEAAEPPSRTVTVAGVVRGLPGSLSGSDPIQYNLPYAIFGSFDTFAPLLRVPPAEGALPLPFESGFDTAVRVLVDLEPEADWETVKAGVLALGATEVLVNEEERREVPLSRVTQSMVAFLRLEAVFSLLVLTAGLGLVLYAASLERPLEMAGIAVRGAGSRVLAGLLWGEVLVIVLIGVLVGVGTGLAGGYLATQTFLVGPPGTETLAPFLLVVPLEVLWFSLLAFTAMSLSALVMAWRVSRTNWARVLKLRAR